MFFIRICYRLYTFWDVTNFAGNDYLNTENGR